jgi:3-methyladenine DNA glycosylase/8-oxoguanine DNA glycosylase
MNLPDQDELYRALVARSEAYEGRFVAGVKTTGIFCRFSCSARKPLKQNVEFFQDKEAAQQKGYRPCLICKPNLSGETAKSVITGDGRRGPLRSKHRLTVELPAQFDSRWTLAFLRARIVSGLESLLENRYSRILRLGNAAVFIQIDFGNQALEVEYSGDASRAEMRRHLRWLFDLDAPLHEFIEKSRVDPILQQVVPLRPNIRLVRISDLFEGLVRAIIGQQISLSAANTVLSRFVARFNPSRPRLVSALQAFPRPSDILRASVSDLQALGLQGGKAKALRACAEYCAAYFSLFDSWDARSTAVCEADLRALPGIGPWTTGYVAMRCSDSRDGFPSNDLVVLKALRRLQTEVGAPATQIATADWRPWRSYAALHLWHLMKPEA